MTNNEAEQMLKALSEHYQCPVMPITRYCAALGVWQDALNERATRTTEEAYPGIHGKDAAISEAAWNLLNEERMTVWSTTDSDRRYLVERLRAHEFEANRVNSIFRDIRKSNLLARLLYDGQTLRKVACPEHKGVWSGVEWGPENACPHGCQLTGWIREDTPAVSAVVIINPEEVQNG